MTDAEINALAEEILTAVVSDISALAPNACRILHKPSGQPFMEFIGTSKLGWGAFNCRYDPLDTVKTLIHESERIFDEFEVTLTNRQTKQTYLKHLKDCAGNDRNKIVRSMALLGAYKIIGGVYPRLTEMMTEGFEDGLIAAESVLIMTVANSPNDDDEEVLSHAKTDMTDAIKKVSQESSERRKKRIRDFVSEIPHVVVEHGRGARAKTLIERKGESEKYRFAVEEAYRALRIELGEKPTKISVARRLGEGGINPKSGNDSSLQAFRLKLLRHELNYDEIVQKVELELNSNS